MKNEKYTDQGGGEHGKRGDRVPVDRLFENLKSEICGIAMDIDAERYRAEEERIRADESLRRISEKADRLSALMQHVSEYPEFLKTDPSLGKLAQEADRAKRDREELRNMRERRLGAGAGRVKFRWRPDHAAAVQIDDQNLDLPPKLALLLWALTRDEGSAKAGDRLVGWKSKKLVTSLMSSRLLTLEWNIDKLVYRLREELKKIGYRSFVQRCAHGLRFALRRRNDVPRGPAG